MKAYIRIVNFVKNNRPVILLIVFVLGMLLLATACRASCYPFQLLRGEC